MAGGEATRARRRLVNACVVYGVPDGLGGTYTQVGTGAWGRPDEALDYAQSRRDAYHERHGATPLTEAPWHREGGYGGLPARYRPPVAAVGIEIRDVRTGELWFVPTAGSPLGPIGPRAQASERTHRHANPEDRLDVEADRPASGTPTRLQEPPPDRTLDKLRQRLDAIAEGTGGPPDLGL